MVTNNEITLLYYSTLPFPDSGMLAEALTVHSLAMALLRMLGSENRIDMGLRGHGVAQDRHNRKRIVRDLMDVYRSICTC